MLFLWLSIVIMIPFDLHRLDGDIDSCGDGNRVPIMQRIIDIGKVMYADDLTSIVCLLVDCIMWADCLK
jgi:hypothetical protein